MMTNEFVLASGIFKDFKYPEGRMVSYSKGEYLSRYPNNKVIFNGNIFTKKLGKIWYGDIDLTKDESTLKLIAKRVGEDLYILREMDGRFDNENKPFGFYEDKATGVIKC